MYLPQKSAYRGLSATGLGVCSLPPPPVGYPRAPVRPRIAGGAVYYTYRYKLKRGREDGPNKAMRVNIPPHTPAKH